MNSPTESSPDVEPAIRLEGVSVGYRMLREPISSFKEYAIRRLQRKIAFSEFMALQDVSLDIRRGEIFGLIGANGAGKSTLLKVVSRVLRPTSGRVRVRGRTAPLLELGAGFDTELTGRENIFLNGAILGYPRADIAGRLEGIVEFSGVREFIDMPLRTYSSGMLARLGFAVATDVRPDILIVDEVLSVGDAQFQKKATDRIERFRLSGVTIVMVAHDLELVRRICHRAAWLSRGRLQAVGSAEDVVAGYRRAVG